jgi:preprotein translocase subunit SecD
VRSLLDAKYSNEYDLTGGGADNTWTLTMKPAVETDLEQEDVEQAIETIRDRVDSLGVSEPLIQEYGLGANQILVELPGISDLDQVKSIIQSTAGLRFMPWSAARTRTSRSPASVNGALPPDEEILPGSGTWHRFERTAYYVCERSSGRGRQRLPLRRSGT